MIIKSLATGSLKVLVNFFLYPSVSFFHSVSLPFPLCNNKEVDLMVTSQARTPEEDT